MKINFNLENPYLPQRKCDLLDAAGSVLGSIFGGLFGSVGQNSANKANLQIARETNAQNYKMFQEQLGFTEDMWNKNNLYNSPSEQMKRYQDAGINPYMALDNISGGNAEAVTTPSPNSAVTGAPMQNTLSPLADSIQNTIPMALAAVSQSLSNKEKAIDLMTRSAENQARVNKLLKDGVLSDSSANYYNMMNKRIGATLPLELAQMWKNLGLTDAHINEAVERTELLKLQRQLSDYDLNFIRPAELREINQRIWKMAEDVKNGRISANAAATSAAAAIIGANASRMDAQTRKRVFENTKDLVRDEIQSRIDLNEWNSSPVVDFDTDLDLGSSEFSFPGVGRVKSPNGRVKTHVSGRKGR